MELEILLGLIGLVGSCAAVLAIIYAIGKTFRREN